MITIIPLMAAFAWIATWLVIVLRLRKQSGHAPGLKTLNSLWLLSLTLHSTMLLLPWLENGKIAIDLFGSLTIVTWLTSLLLFLAHTQRPLETLGLVVIPCTLITLLLDATLDKSGNTITLQNGLGLHIILSLLAYSILALATLQALPVLSC